MSSALWNDFRYLWIKCLLTGPFKQKIGHFWDDYENWQFSLLLWHPLYKCKSYSASFPRLVEDFLRNLSPCCILVSMSMFYDDKSGRCHLFLFHNNSASPNFPSTGWDDSKNLIKLFKAFTSKDPKWTKFISHADTEYLSLLLSILNQFVIIWTNTPIDPSFIFNFCNVVNAANVFSLIPAGLFAIAFDKNCGSLHKNEDFD